jgi:hypothetical protein
MPEIRSQVPHQLAAAEAKRRIMDLIDNLETRFPSQVRNSDRRWNGEVCDLEFDTYGFHVRWSVVVQDSQINMVGEIPISARMLEHKIEQTMVSRIEQVLEPVESQRRAA